MVGQSLEVDIHRPVGDDKEVGHGSEGAKVHHYNIMSLLLQEQPGDFIGEYFGVVLQFFLNYLITDEHEY